MTINNQTITITKYNEIDLRHEQLLRSEGYKIEWTEYNTKTATSPAGKTYDLCTGVEVYTKEQVDAWQSSSDIHRDVPDYEFACELSEMLNDNDIEAVYKALKI